MAARTLGAAVLSALALLAGAAGAQGALSDQPQVAVDKDGNAHFTWRRHDGIDMVKTRKRGPNGTFSAVQDLSASGQNARAPQVAIDPQGNAYFVWLRSNGSHAIAQTRKRAANGTLSAVQDLSAGGQSAFAPQVAADPQGNAYFVWWRSNGSDAIVQFRRRAANGTLGSVQGLSAAGEGANFPQVAVDPPGNAYFVWRRGDTSPIVQTRRRAAGGSLSAVQDLSDPGEIAFDPQLAVDQQSNATFLWRRGAVIQTRRRGAGGALGAVQDLSAAGQDAGPGGRPQVAVDPTGTASFVWAGFNALDEIVRTRRRTADGLLSLEQELFAAPGIANQQQLGVDQLGNAYFVWNRNDVIQTRRRAPDGTLTAVQNVTG